MTTQLTPKSLQVFLKCAREADCFDGSPWVSVIPLNFKNDRGNLSDLVKKGFIEIDDNGGKGNAKDMCIDFTKKGIALANEHGITCSEW